MNEIAALAEPGLAPLVLNVDDSEAALYAKTRALRIGGYPVIEAETGEAALLAVAEHEPALVVLDVKLPDIDGFEVCRRIKREHPEVVVLQTSATFLDRESRIRGLEGGADSYLTQPVEREELLAVVRSLLRLRAAEDALRAANATLEARVAERTAALERALARVEAEAAERRRMEATLAQAQKMEAIGRLTGGVAHDFNNLLQAVSSGASLIEHQAERPERVRELAGMVAHAAERGTSLVARLLAFARRQDLVEAPLDAEALMRGMAELMNPTLGSAVRLEIEFADGLWPLRADANQLELALLNLAINARDAMPAGGVLRVTGRNAPAGSGPAPAGLAHGDYVVLTVSDTGTGMDEATLARAVEPFFTTKGTGKGTGLGLSMVHGLVEQLGGRLKLESVPGRGTAVELWLPRAWETGAPVDEPIELAPVGECGPLRVLVVDDDLLVLQSVVALLVELGHTAIEAESGEAALEALRAGEAVDVLLTDHIMPGMTGAELIGAAQLMRPGLPAALATAYAELPPNALPQRTPVLRKPYGQQDLAVALAGLVSGLDSVWLRRAASGGPGAARDPLGP